MKIYTVRIDGGYIIFFFGGGGGGGEWGGIFPCSSKWDSDIEIEGGGGEEGRRECVFMIPFCSNEIRKAF